MDRSLGTLSMTALDLSEGEHHQVLDDSTHSRVHSAEYFPARKNSLLFTKPVCANMVILIEFAKATST